VSEEVLKVQLSIPYTHPEDHSNHHHRQTWQYHSNSWSHCL